MKITIKTIDELVKTSKQYGKQLEDSSLPFKNDVFSFDMLPYAGKTLTVSKETEHGFLARHAGYYLFTHEMIKRVEA